MGTVFFTAHLVVDFASALTSDTKRFARVFCAMLERGVYVAPSQFEAAFVSLAHTKEDLDKTLAAADEALKKA
jgi:glutamate-1-semialdehyde 2,1-aminomutase